MYMCYTCVSPGCLGDEPEIPGCIDQHSIVSEPARQHGAGQLETVAAYVQLGGRPWEGGA